MTGKNKVAILLACLGPEAACRVLTWMSEEEVEQVSFALSNLGSVDAGVRLAVMGEFHLMALARRYLSQGEVAAARHLVESAFGAEGAGELLARLQRDTAETPLRFLKDIDAGRVHSFIEEEHPQTMAVILAHLEAPVSAAILALLPEDLQADVVGRIVTLEPASPGVLGDIEHVLERKVVSAYGGAFRFAAGAREAAEILDCLDAEARRAVIEGLERRDPEAAGALTRGAPGPDELPWSHNP